MEHYFKSFYPFNTPHPSFPLHLVNPMTLMNMNSLLPTQPALNDIIRANLAFTNYNSHLAPSPSNPTQPSKKLCKEEPLATPDIEPTILNPVLNNMDSRKLQSVWPPLLTQNLPQLRNSLLSSTNLQAKSSNPLFSIFPSQTMFSGQEKPLSGFSLSQDPTTSSLLAALAQQKTLKDQMSSFPFANLSQEILVAQNAGILPCSDPVDGNMGCKVKIEATASSIDQPSSKNNLEKSNPKVKKPSEARKRQPPVGPLMSELGKKNISAYEISLAISSQDSSRGKSTRVGSGYQVDIPALDKDSKKRNIKEMWDPTLLKDENLDEILEEFSQSLQEKIDDQQKALKLLVKAGMDKKRVSDNLKKNRQVYRQYFGLPLAVAKGKKKWRK